LTFEPDPQFKDNAIYLGQMSFSSKVIMWTHK